MGLTDFLSSAMEYLNITEVAHADAPEKDDEDEGSKDEGGDEKEEKDDGEEKEDGGDGDDEEKDEGGDDDAEEEEEEEEEPVDPKPALEEGELPCCISQLSIISIRVYSTKPERLTQHHEFIECAKSSQCRGYKHHYDECVERVTAHENDPEAHKGQHKEDCVEECEL
jgi:ubiquinol-cytochrome c reductase subunit 6